MQQSRRPVQPRSSRLSGFFGSRLMVVLLAVAVIVVGFLTFRATRPNSGATATATPGRVASAQAAGHGAARHVTPRAKPTATLSLPAIQRQTELHDRKQYAASIVPTLDRSAGVFDQAAGGASTVAGNFDRLGAQCTFWGSKIVALETQYEGIPHPYLWWTPAGTLHHQTSGIYHYMLGALQNCQEAIQSTDSDAAAAAISQMATAAHNLHAQENYARYLATH